MAISSTGVGSGLDVNSIVTQLMALEQRPLTLLQTKATTIQTTISAFGSLKSQLSNLDTVATRLGDPANWNPLSTSSTDSATVSASASATASAGSYAVEVTQLAQAQALSSGTFASSSTVVGTGQLVLELGTTAAGVFTPRTGILPKLITIDSSNQTLGGIRDAINASGAGVTASIVTSGGASRLVLRSPTGADSSMRLTATDADGNSTDTTGLSALAWDPAASVGAGRNMNQTQGALDANYSLNGLQLTSATNSPADVVNGLTLKFSKLTTVPVEVGISIDNAGLRKNINDFVTAYNGVNTLMKSQTAADPTGGNNGPLQGDFTARSLLGALSDTLHGTVSGLGTAASLNSVGIELQRDGSLLVNDTRLTPLLATPDKLAKLFSQPQSGSDVSSRGIGVRFKQWTDALTSDTGIIASRTQGLAASITSNNKSQDAVQTKLTATEARLRKQYQTLDTQMSNLNAQLAQLKSSLGLT
ncbi:flagellar filament capping protein FliD [soil metagenome]